MLSEVHPTGIPNYNLDAVTLLITSRHWTTKKSPRERNLVHQHQDQIIKKKEPLTFRLNT